MITPAHPPRRLLRKREVVALVGISPRMIDLLEADGRFPGRVTIASSRRVAWDSIAVQEFIDNQVSAGAEAPV